MKDNIITITREEWERMLEYRKAPIKKRYEECHLLFLDEKEEFKSQIE